VSRYKILSKIDRSRIFFCLVGPAGSGKTSLSRKLLEDSARKLKKIVSVTTRAPRPNEINKVNYIFISREDFIEARDRGEFFESEEIHGNLYGQLNSSLQDALNGEQDLVFDIDIRGARSIKKQYPKQTVIVFLMPPDKQALIDRMRARAPISSEELDRRLATAEQEIKIVLDSAGQDQLIDYCLINDDFEMTLNNLKLIVEAETHEFSRFSVQSLLERWK
jgi:guanylate kinase